MKKNIIKSLFLALALGVGLSSCEDMLTPDMDRHNEVDEIATDTLYSYWGILKSLQNVAERYVILGECRGDLVSGTSYVSDSIHSILNFGRDGGAADGSCRYLKVSDFYHIINSCNTYIAQCDTLKLTGAGESVMRREYAQVVSIRAWVYLQLVLTYGEVPYMTEPMLSTERIDNYWANSRATVNADNLAQTEVVTKLEEVRDVPMPDYGKYGRTAIVAYAQECCFPQTLVLGDIYLMTARKGDEATYRKAAQAYYDFLNTEFGGPIPPTSYFCTQERNDQNELVQLSVSTNWYTAFSQNAKPSASNEKVTVIPSSTNKLWGTVMRGVNEVFGFTSQLSVNINEEDTTTQASITLSPNFEREVAASKAYQDLNDAQVYEAYLGPDGAEVCIALEGAGDGRRYVATRDYSDRESGFSDPVSFIMKQNIGGFSWNFLSGGAPVQGYCTTYPIIYRKGTIWLRFAEALNGAGFPGYAFAILRNGLCGNSIWQPSQESQYEPKTYRYYDVSEIALDSATMKRDTVWYNQEADFLTHIAARAEADSVFTADPDLDPDTWMAELGAYITAHTKELRQVPTSYQEWTIEGLTNIANYHISLSEMRRAKGAPFLNFSTLYLRGSVSQYYQQSGTTEYNLVNTLTLSSDPVTIGIHSRGCGLIPYTERETSYNYVDQINKMLATYEGVSTPMTKEQIYDPANLDRVQTAISDLILDEMALETSFEGNRFFDLMRFARARGNADELARRVAMRSGTEDGALRTFLQNERNWYYPLPVRK